VLPEKWLGEGWEKRWEGDALSAEDEFNSTRKLTYGPRSTGDMRWRLTWADVLTVVAMDIHSMCCGDFPSRSNVDFLF
jgi:hypothetical protein